MVINNTYKISATVATIALALGACTPQTGGQTKTVVGTINGFGSVIVNGVKYASDKAKITVDGVPAGQQDLSPGMKVKLKAQENGRANTADSIEYDHEIEGIVVTNDIPTGQAAGTMNVMGQTVTITLDTIVEISVPGLASVDLVTPGMVIEVSGYSDGNGNVTATYVEVEAPDQATHQKNDPKGMDVEGLIAGLDTTAKTFRLGDLTVDYSAADRVGFATEIANGVLVEVESNKSLQGNTLVADVIELEDEGDMDHDGEDGEEVEIQGEVTQTLVGNTMEVNGQEVKVNTALTVLQGIQNNSLVIGDKVIVEGKFDSAGAVIANAISAVMRADREMGAPITNVNMTGPGEGTITIGDKTIIITPDTAMDDDLPNGGMGPDQMLHVGSLEAGEYVEVSYYMDSDTGIYYATSVERSESM